MYVWGLNSAFRTASAQNAEGPDGPMSASAERENTMAQPTPPLTEEKILEALRAQGITNLQELAQKSVEGVGSRDIGTINSVFVFPHFVFKS